MSDVSDYYYPILSICMGVGAFIVLEVGRRLRASRVLSMAEWASEVEHVMVERIRAGIYVAECDEALRKLLEKAPVSHGEAMLVVLELTRKIETNYSALIADVLSEEKKPTLLKKLFSRVRPPAMPNIEPPASEPPPTEQSSLVHTRGYSEIPDAITVSTQPPPSSAMVSKKPALRWLDGQLVP